MMELLGQEKPAKYRRIVLMNCWWISGCQGKIVLPWDAEYSTEDAIKDALKRCAISGGTTVEYLENGCMKVGGRVYSFHRIYVPEFQGFKIPRLTFLPVQI